MPNVSFKRPELEKILPIYDLISDCVEGELAVKNKTTDYLPKPNSTDLSQENAARYEAYLKRAVFYNVTGRTLEGLVGEIYSRDPVIELPKNLEIVNDDVNGNGVSLTQLSKKACKYVIEFGRAGLLTDYPNVDAPLSKAELESQNIRPTINLYRPENIINWRTKIRGAKSVLSLVVLSEEVSVFDDGFERKEREQWRVLRLGPSKENNFPEIIDDPDIYTIEVWRIGENAQSMIVESYQPRDFSGKYFDEIQFDFIGSENNDSEIDSAPMYPIAALNIAHYRNSADYEEACYITGQATPWATGLDEKWVSDVLKGKIPLGSRGGIPLPVGASIGLLQAEANSMPFEAMAHKERQMSALGARIVEQEVIQRTATEASLESATENSVLSTIAKNVSNAYENALYRCLSFVGNETTKIVFELNSDFDLAKMTFDEASKIINMWNQAAISDSEMRQNIRYAGLKLDNDAAAMKEIENAKELETKRQIELAGINNSKGLEK